MQRLCSPPWQNSHSPHGEPRLDQDAVSRREARDTRADRVDRPRPVRAGDLRERHVRDAVAHEDVEAIQGGGPDRDTDLARPGLRLGPVSVLQDVVGAVLPEEDRLHCRLI